MATQYAKRLDKTRPHGSYHPPMDGAFFVQDGYDFDHEGRIVEAHLSEADRETLKKLPPPKPAQAKKADAAEPNKPGEDGDGDPGDGNGEDTDGINLEMWLKGEADYQFQKVQQAVRKRLNTWKTGKRDLVLFLVEDQKLVPAESLSDEFKSMIV